MEKISTRRPKGKAPLVTKRDQVSVGLDVHKLNVHAAVRITGELFGSKGLSTNAKMVASKI